jgi:hypothetical protein
VHLPATVPKEDVERNTLIYLYENWDKYWTLGEDQALREMYDKFLQKNGKKVLQYRGTFTMDNKIKFSLTVSEDRAFQQERDKWVAEKLYGLIKKGRADAPKSIQESTGPKILTVKTSDGRTIRLMTRSQGPRIDMPW